MPAISRRTVLQGAGGLGVAAWAAAEARGKTANERLTIGMMGFRGRGAGLLAGFLARPDIDVAAVCDIDAAVLDKGVATVEKARGRKPRAVEDFRRLLDDPTIDALVMGTPDHWHAIPTVLACQAAKHVYVEKPASHNIREGQAMLAAARKHKRVVQVGVQSRSGKHFADAVAFVKSGALGKVTFARAWESTRQGALGFPPDGQPPSGVNYDLWLGPAPSRPFNPLRFHGNWRWFFDYGTGDLGNDGVHRIDVARRMLAAGLAAQGKTLPDWPTAVATSGGKYVFHDAQEFPDTMLVAWDYPGATLCYEMRIWSGYKFEGFPEGAAVYGENGYVAVGNNTWRAFGPKGEPLDKGTETSGEQIDAAHKENFVACIRDGGLPNFDIAEAHISSSLCHMGNTAWRVGRKLHFDATTQSYAHDEEANRFLSREYRKPWVLPVV